MAVGYTQSVHTIVVSDLHLSEAQELDPKRPLWMAYKRPEHFIDEDFARFLEHLEAEAEGPIELVLNGDVFDFDNVIQLPDEPEGTVDWLARARGLGSEEWMSRFKIERIIEDHPVWFGALRDFIARGHRAVFVIGNHDLELHWPGVQRRLREALGVDDDDEALVFCAWFYLSGDDTFITHGHQYDPMCAVPDAIDPLIEVHGRPRVRIAFGDLAERYMLNGMGYFNPHATGNYIMSLWAYVKFFFRYMVRTQPFLLWSWFWSAIVTMVVSLRDHLRPPMRDPLLVEEKVAAIAKRSRATPRMVRQLAALSEPPASASHPMAIIRELWLDRAFLLAGVLGLAWQVVLHINFAWPISPLWVFAALAVLLPPYVIYAARVKSGVFSKPLLDARRAELIHEITGAETVIMGHTHEPVDEPVGPVHYINGGFWSPAFDSPECNQRIGTQSFVWVHPTTSGSREATLFEWSPGAEAPAPYLLPTAKPKRKRTSLTPPRLRPESA